MKFNNRFSAPPESLQEYRVPEMRLVDTGKEVVSMPEEKDRYQQIPASAYDLERQLKDGVALESCPSYIRLEKMYGSDVAMRTVSKLQNMVENERVRLANEEFRKRVFTPAAPAPAPAAVE